MQGEEHTKPSSSDFASLSKKISGRTTDILAIAIVAIGLLTVGRQLVTWWQTDPVESVNSQDELQSVLNETGSMDFESSFVTMEFGDKSFAVQREEFEGDDIAVETEMKTRSRERLRRSNAPIYGERIVDVEQRLLDSTMKTPPIEEEKGQWQIYRAVQPFPMVIGVKSWLFEQSITVRRVVSWSMAFPTGPQNWTVVEIRGRTNGTNGIHPSEIPVPVNGRIAMTLQSKDGGRTVFLKGDGSAQEWANFLGDWFKAHQWASSSPARSFANGQSVSYDAPATDHWSRVNIHLSQRDEKRIDCLLSYSVRSSSSSKNLAGKKDP